MRAFDRVLVAVLVLLVGGMIAAALGVIGPAEGSTGNLSITKWPSDSKLNMDVTVRGTAGRVPIDVHGLSVASLHAVAASQGDNVVVVDGKADRIHLYRIRGESLVRVDTQMVP